MSDSRARVAHVISPDFCKAIFTVHIHFCHFLWLCVSQVEPGQGVLVTYYDSYSVPFLSRAHFSPPSSIKRLRGSLAPRSSCPLASTAQFFEVMPGWSEQAAPLTGEPPVLLRQYRVRGEQMARPPPSLHYYFIVWFCIPPAQPVVDTDPSVLLLTHVYSSLPQREQTKQKGEVEEKTAWPNSPPTLN